MTRRVLVDWFRRAYPFGSFAPAWRMTSTPTLIRIVVIFLCVMTGLLPFIITYIAARLIMPEARS